MLFFVFAAYLLLSLPVTGCAQAFASGPRGAAVVELRAAGLRLRIETKIRIGKRGGKRARGMLIRALRRAACVRQLDVHLRIGLGDAWQTALAAGGARAAALSLLSALPAPRDTRVIVTPDFAQSGFCAHLRCIFSVAVGDIMLAAASAAIKKTK